MASHSSRIYITQFKHGDKTTSLPIILQVSTLVQTGSDSSSPSTKQITDMIHSFHHGSTMKKATVTSTQVTV